MKDLMKHKFIVIGGDAVNALGVIWSLGNVGIKSYILGEWEPQHKAALSKSKYVESIDMVQNNEDIYRVLMDKFGNEEYKPFLFFTWEHHEAFIDKHYNELKDKFYFYNAGCQGSINRLLSKSFQCELAAECGIRVPQHIVVSKGALNHGISYPIITKTH